MSISQILHDKIENAMSGKEGEEYFRNIGLLHDKIHRGKLLRVVYTFESVDDNETVYIRHTQGATKSVHSIVDIETTGQWRFTSYSGTTYSNDGVVLPILNRNTASDYVTDVIFRRSAVPLVLGTERLNYLFGSGTTRARATSGGSNDDLETDFQPNIDVLVGLTNLSGATQYVTFKYEFYEE